MPHPETPDSPGAQADTLDSEFHKIAHDAAIKRVEDERILHPNQLLPEKALLKRYEEEMLQQFSTNHRRQENGASQLTLSLQELQLENPELFTQEVTEGINRLASLPSQIAKDEKGFTECMNRGGTLQEFAGLSDLVMNVMYKAAKRLYEQKLFDDAADAFLFLTGLNPRVFAFWLGLGNAEYYSKQLEGALIAYKRLVEIDPLTPSNYLTVSRCYEEIGDPNSAINILDQALSTLEQTEAFTSYKPSLEQEKQRLKQLLHH